MSPTYVSYFYSTTAAPLPPPVTLLDAREHALAEARAELQVEPDTRHQTPDTRHSPLHSQRALPGGGRRGCGGVPDTRHFSPRSSLQAVCNGAYLEAAMEVGVLIVS
jgi:hypothetical protein